MNKDKAIAYCFNANYLLAVTDIYKANTQYSDTKQLYFSAIFEKMKVTVSLECHKDFIDRCTTSFLENLRGLFYKDKGLILITRNYLMPPYGSITIEINHETTT